MSISDSYGSSRRHHIEAFVRRPPPPAGPPSPWVPATLFQGLCFRALLRARGIDFPVEVSSSGFVYATGGWNLESCVPAERVDALVAGESVAVWANGHRVGVVRRG